MIPPMRHSLSRNVPLTAGTVFGSGQFLGLLADGALLASLGQPEFGLPCAEIRIGRNAISWNMNMMAVERQKPGQLVMRQ